jgi:hypothetical protein
LAGRRGTSALRDFGIALIGATLVSTIVWMVWAQQPPGVILLVLLSYFTAPLAVEVAWWFTPLLVAVAAGVAVVAYFPLPRWLRISGFALLVVLWMGSGLIWLGQQT